MEPTRVDGIIRQVDLPITRQPNHFQNRFKSSYF